MPIALPTSSDVRKARARADRFAHAQWDMVRTPVLAGIGAGELAVRRVRELPGRLRGEQLRARADQAAERARKTYDGWTARGEDTVEQVRARPGVARALRTAQNTDKQVSKRVEKIVDELHDAGQELLDTVSFESRSIGEKTARRTQRLSREAAGTVTDVSAEVATELIEAGDQAAHDTRSASRKAANRVAPAEDVPRRKPRTTN